MGLDVSASIIVGVRLEFHDEKRPVTKYNENTGKPYQTTVAHKYVTLPGHAQEIPLETDDDGNIWDLEGDEFFCGDPENYRSYLLGIRAVEIDQYTREDSCPIPDLTHYESQAQELLRKRYDYHGPVRAYLVLHLSY